jgi:hypothetical protein
VISQAVCVPKRRKRCCAALFHWRCSGRTIAPLMAAGGACNRATGMRDNEQLRGFRNAAEELDTLCCILDSCAIASVHSQLAVLDKLDAWTASHGGSAVLSGTADSSQAARMAFSLVNLLTRHHSKAQLPTSIDADAQVAVMQSALGVLLALTHCPSVAEWVRDQPHVSLLASQLITLGARQQRTAAIAEAGGALLCVCSTRVAGNSPTQAFCSQAHAAAAHAAAPQLQSCRLPAAEDQLKLEQRLQSAASEMADLQYAAQQWLRGHDVGWQEATKQNHAQQCSPAFVEPGICNTSSNTNVAAEAPTFQAIYEGSHTQCASPRTCQAPARQSRRQVRVPHGSCACIGARHSWIWQA